MDLNLDSDKAYRAEVRLTETRGFGGSSLSQSFSRGTPEELLSSLGKDINEYRSVVQSLGQAKSRKEDLRPLRTAIEDKLSQADQEIKAKVSRGESSIVINKLTDQLKEQNKQFENLKKQERDTMEGDSVQESHVDSFTSEPTANDGDTLAQEADLVDQSALNIREQQATEIRGLERDIEDLHDISKNINVMIVEQGGQVERIETHAEKAAARTEKGAANTTAAVALKRQNNWLLIVLLCVGGGVVLIVIVIVVVLAVVLTRN